MLLTILYQAIICLQIESESALPSLEAKPSETTTAEKLIFPIPPESPKLTPELLKEADNPKPIKASLAPLPAQSGPLQIKDKDGEFSLRFIGLFQADVREYRRKQDTTDIDTFLIRRARLGAEGVYADEFEYRILPQFNDNNVRLLDTYINWHPQDSLQFRVGKFRLPFGFEPLIQIRQLPTIERSLLEPILPNRDTGAMLWGLNLLENRFDYMLAVSNGQRDADIDTNPSKQVVGRVVFRPTPDPQHSITRGLSMGYSVSFGLDSEAVTPATYRTALGVPWFNFDSGTRYDGSVYRHGPELMYCYQSFGFGGQAVWAEDEFRPAKSQPYQTVTVPMHGWIFMATFLLTGEERSSLAQVIEPNRPFRLKHGKRGSGAWEVITRLARLELGDQVFDPKARLADPSKSTQGTTEFTLGLNWYLHRNMKIMLAWEHSTFDQPIQLSKSAMDHQDTFAIRWQLHF
jgi:phosphate-selective porin OprO and OprP